MRRALLVLATALPTVALTCVLTAAPAGAHAEVREADPPVEGTGPLGQDELTITFITMDPSVPPTIEVLDPDGRDITTGAPTIVEEAATGITVAVPIEPLEAGRHVVRWEAMATDGDGLTSDEYAFVAEEASSSNLGVWLLWIVALALPAAILLRPKRTKA